MSKQEKKPQITLPDVYGEIEPFSISFTDWVDKYGFFIKDTWDQEKGKWGRAGWMTLQPVQRRIFDYVLQQNEDHEFKYSTLLYSTTKKSGKTALSAAIGGWFAEVCPAGSEIYCLSYRTPVLLPGGKTRRVRDLVEEKYDGEVMSYNPLTDTLEPKKVIGWHKSILGDRKYVFITYKGARYSGKDNKRECLLSTDDHPILASSGWVRAGDIKVGDKVATKFRALNPEQEQVFVGTVLGDACILINKGQTELGHFTFAHCKKQREWLDLKAHSMQEIIRPATYNKSNNAYYVNSLSSPYFSEQRSRWYPKGKKIVDREGVERNFSPLMMATWFLDDGSPNHNWKKNSHNATLEVMGFTWDDAQWLSDLLHRNKIYNTLGGFRGKPRIFILNQGYRNLSEMIGKYVPPSMRYKLVPGSPEYDSSCWDLGSTITYFSEVEEFTRNVKEENVIPREKTVYCLDVEDNHNFVAGGLVVHNCVANDLDQAEGRMMRDLKYHAQVREYKVNKYSIELPNGTTIQALAQSYKSVAGSRHALVLFEEIWGITTELTRRTYEEMTPIPTIPWSLRAIATYAGFTGESDLLWDLYLSGVGKDEHDDGKGQLIKGMYDIPVWENGKQFTYWNHEPTMPWQTPEYYDSQRETLRAAAYLRLHENRWVTTHEEFIPIDWWDYAASQFEGSAELWKDHPYAKFPLYLGIDAAPKKDSTAVVACCYDSSKGIVVDVMHKIWTPTDGQLDFDITLKSYIIWLYTNYNVVSISYDPAHLYQLMLQLGNVGYPVNEYTQTLGNMTKASQNLYDLLKFRRLYSYKDDEARTHVQNTVAQSETNGFRIVKQKATSKGQSKPMDYTLALSIAAYKAVEGGGVDVSIPIEIISPFSDVTGYKPENKGVPWMFQSD